MTADVVLPAQPAEVTVDERGRTTIDAGQSRLLFADPAAALQWLQDACTAVVRQW